MQGIAFDLCRTSEMAFREKSAAVSGHGHSGRKVERLSWNGVLGRPDVRDNFFAVCWRAGGQACESKGCSDQRQELPAVHAKSAGGRALRKFSVEEFLKLGGAGKFFQTLPSRRR